MSWAREVALFCDVEDCDEWTHGSLGGGTLSEARDVAARDGWSYSRADGDRCPHCTSTPSGAEDETASGGERE